MKESTPRRLGVRDPRVKESTPVGKRVDTQLLRHICEDAPVGSRASTHVGASARARTHNERVCGGANRLLRGQVLGGLDTVGRGQRVDLASGDITESGTALLPEHLGATLLALGDVDPADYISNPQPIAAAMA